MKNVDLVLVEDNPKDAFILLRILKKEGFEDTVWLKDGEEAVNTLVEAEAWLPKLILLDMKLPKLSGFEVLSMLKKHPKMSQVPVVVFSSLDQQVHIQSAYREGANAYIIKPQHYHKSKKVVKMITDFWIRSNQTI